MEEHVVAAPPGECEEPGCKQLNRGAGGQCCGESARKISTQSMLWRQFACRHASPVAQRTHQYRQQPPDQRAFLGSAVATEKPRHIEHRVEALPLRRRDGSDGIRSIPLEVETAELGSASASIREALSREHPMQMPMREARF